MDGMLVFSFQDLRKSAETKGTSSGKDTRRTYCFALVNAAELVGAQLLESEKDAESIGEPFLATWTNRGGPLQIATVSQHVSASFHADPSRLST